ncbi:MAG: tetratricopeptide repeat protein, partial [Promethearchaeota archaeon]
EPLLKFWKIDIEMFFREMLQSVRVAFMTFLNLTGVSDFTKVYFYKKNLGLVVKNYMKGYVNRGTDPDFKDLVFPIPNPWFEILMSNNLRFPSWNLFIKPPETFDELHARQVFLESQKQTKQGGFAETVSAYSRILAIFNKSGQKYGFFLTLLELARLAVKVGNYDEVKKKYTMVIQFAKKNEGIINSDEFIMIQEEFAEAHLKFENKDDAIRQITLLYNYLERSRPETDTKRIDMLLKLNEVFISRDDYESIEGEIVQYFRKIKDFAEKHRNKLILIEYHRILGMYYARKGKLSNAVASFKRGVSEAQGLGLIKNEIAIMLEISKVYLYGKKKDLKAASRYLEHANELIGKTDDLLQELKIYEMLYDLYRQTDNYELSSFYDKQSSQLRMALRKRGLL